MERITKMARSVKAAYFDSPEPPWYARIVKSLAYRAVGVTCAALAVAGCYLFPKEEKVLAPPLISQPEVAYSTVKAEKGTIESSTAVSADFVSVSQAAYFFRIGGSRLARLAVKLGDEVKPGQLLAELDTGSLATRIAQQKLLVRKAQVTSERAVALGRDRFERELADIDVQLAQLQLQDLQSQLDEAKLVAVAPGTVVYVAGMTQGDIVDAYRTVVQVADPKNLQLVYRGEKSGDFRVGNAVTVRLSDGRSYPGSVTMAPGSTPADVTEDLRGAIVVGLRILPPGARIGDTATVTRLLARRENVVVLPRDVVHTYLGRDFVQVLENGQMRERTVQLGVQTSTEVEIVSGLSAGEEVLAP
jgi:multidrug efflux pump subunit AcrA (membrane-fusion protein)